MAAMAFSHRLEPLVEARNAAEMDAASVDLDRHATGGAGQHLIEPALVAGYQIV